MKRRRSLFFRLLFTFFLLGIGIILSFILSFRFLGNESIKRNITNNYENYLHYIIEDIGHPVTLDGLKRVHKKLNVGIIYENLRSSNDLPFLNDITLVHQITDRLSIGSRKNDRFLVLKENNVTIAFAVNVATTENFPLEAMITAILISVLLFLLCYFYIKRLFLPLDLIREGTAHFAKGDFTYPIPVNEGGQLGELSRSIAKMGNEIQRMLEAKRELLLAIAHELRTPLTRAKLHTELLEDSRKKDISKNIDEMSNLVNDLLESERLNLGHQALHETLLSGKKLINDVIKEHFPGKQIQTHLSDINLQIDEKLYSLAIKNLLKNAFNHGSGDVSIHLDRDAIVISNKGIKIEEKIIANIFEPFYKGEPSRVRNDDGEGVGLGLYLVSQIIKAHGHTISAKSNNGTFTMTIGFQSENNK